MPGKGYFVKADDQFCARLGITEAEPTGNNFLCEASETLEDFSCGVTGCFAVIAGKVHFREGITSEDPTGTAWVSIENAEHESFNKIEAGPIYELWAITADGYPYRRLGMKDGIPMGEAWELVPDILLKVVSFGIYGPVGITRDENLIIIWNGK